MNSLKIESCGTASDGIGKNNLKKSINLFASSYCGDLSSTEYSSGSTYVFKIPIS